MDNVGGKVITISGVKRSCKELKDVSNVKTNVGVSIVYKTVGVNAGVKRSCRELEKT